MSKGKLPLRGGGHGDGALASAAVCSASTLLLLLCAIIMWGSGLFFNLSGPAAQEHQHYDLSVLPGFQLVHHSGDGADGADGMEHQHGSAVRLLAEQQAGGGAAVADVPGYEGPPYILPKLIHQTVKDKANMPCETRESIQTWIDLNPGYTHILYDDADLLDFVKSHYPQLLDMFLALPTNIERTDTWRYLVLHKLGGVYADSDVKCMQPISTWNAEHGYDAALMVGIAKRNMKTGATMEFNQFVMAAMPGHPVMATMPIVIAANLAWTFLRGPGIVDHGKRHDNQILMRTGPKAFTSALHTYAQRVRAAWPVNSSLADQQGGVLFGSVRAMPKFVFGAGWDTIDHNMTCAEVKKYIRPEALICHQFFGTWKDKPEDQLKDRKLTYGDCAPLNHGAGDAGAGAEPGGGGGGADGAAAEPGQDARDGDQEQQQQQDGAGGGAEAGEQPGTEVVRYASGDDGADEQPLHLRHRQRQRHAHT